MKKICIIDYGLGNIKSLFNSLKKIGFNPEFFSNKKNKLFDMVFIPGVGSYYKASKLIHQKKHFIFQLQLLVSQAELQVLRENLAMSLMF